MVNLLKYIKSNKQYCLLIIISMTSLVLFSQYAPTFGSLSFYDPSSGKDDLHYDYGWTRSDTNVRLNGVNLRAIPTNSNRTLWFQTVALRLSGSDILSFNHLLSNVGGSGSKTLTIKLIDTFTLQETVVSTVSYTNASQQTSTAATVSLDSTGVYWIRFVFNHTGDVNSNPYFQVNSFSTTTTPILLPVTLSSFKVTQNKSIPQLLWTTLSETNSSHFEIFRSTDAVLYNYIGYVSAMGESYSPVDYQFLDNDYIHSGPSVFYQLVQVDLNGNRYVLGIVKYHSVDDSGINKISVSNINQSTIQVSRESNIKIRSEISIEIIDLNGRMCIKDSMNPGEINKKINIDQLVSGIYLIGNPGIGYNKLVVVK
jgi:hypothetical protein